MASKKRPEHIKKQPPCYSGSLNRPGEQGGYYYNSRSESAKKQEIAYKAKDHTANIVLTVWSLGGALEECFCESRTDTALFAIQRTYTLHLRSR